VTGPPSGDDVGHDPVGHDPVGHDGPADGGPVLVTPAVLHGDPLPDHGSSTDKHERGSALVVGGTSQTPGAVLLAGVAALRAGAGRIQLATVEATAVALGVAVPEAAVLGLPVDGDDHFGEEAVARLLPVLGDAGAVLVGSGTFEPEASAALVRAAVAELADGDTCLLVDAGALPLLADDPDLLRPLGDRAVAMPNPHEMALLLDVDDEEVDEDPAAALAAAVERFGCTVTLRGGETWSSGPGQPVFLDRSGGPGLGTSGSGDVLAGLLTGYLARGAGPLCATLWATHVHGSAGERCAARLGSLGYLARELLDEVPAVHRDLVAH
jgi:ADP-dependent NAD(P)H-hydrate dehydratase